MASVTNLQLNLQTGSDNTYYATWTFNETSKSTPTSTTVKKGSQVKVKSGSTWYNGASIPSFVFNTTYYVVELNGDRAVINTTNTLLNPTGAINVKNLTLSGSATTTSTSSDDLSKTLDHYEVRWYYHTGDNVWFGPSESNVTVKQATYSPQENAIKIKVGVKPVAKTRKVNDKDTPYWTGTWTYVTRDLGIDPPATPSAPDVQLENFKMTCTLDGIEDPKADKIQFQVYNGITLFTSGIASVKTQRAVFTCTVSSGGKYRVRCRAINVYGKTEVNGEWSPYSGEQTTIPHAITGLTVERRNATSVQLNWHKVEAATSYEIQYVTSKKYFDTSSDVGSASSTESRAFISGLNSGTKWFFRVRAVNGVGESGWSKIVSVTVGTEPEPPTTWTLTSTAVVGEDIVIYWTHNTEDGSRMTEAEILLNIDGKESKVTVTVSQDEIDKAIQEGEPEKIHSHTIKTGSYKEGAKIKYRIRTKGILDDFSDWSDSKTVELFAKPSISLHLNDLVAGDTNNYLDSYPLEIITSVTPVTQTPITYHVTITAVGDYESMAQDGSTYWVSNGDTIYSQVFTTKERDFQLILEAGDVLFEDDRRYKVKVTVAMDSGLTAEAQTIFAVHLKEMSGILDASINIYKPSLSAYISPIYYEEQGDEKVLIEDVSLSVYRREYNGTLTLIDAGSYNDGTVTVMDEYPSLDYARYRIVARNDSSGKIAYEDLPGIYIGEPSIVIQWKEPWTNFDYEEGVVTETPDWPYSMVRLPYNVDISENYNQDVSLIEYIGRKHPVSYYGTQRGETASWSTEIDKQDKETLYALRRLAVWPGDVYVREPSGIGYRARVSVSMSVNHLSLTVPVSFDITRVEGDDI